MPTTILAPGTAPANSTDITVADAPINVGAYRDDGELPEHNFRGLIYRKDAGGGYSQTKFSVNRDRPNQVITGPGVYQVRRSGVFTVATGIQTD